MSLVTIERSSSSDNLSQISGERVESEEDQVDAELSEDVFGRSRSASSVEGFFASKGAAYAIPDGDFARKASLKGGEIQSHLQGMVNLIRDEDTMRLVVKVESEAKYTRYLSIVTTYGLSDEEESVVLGFDWIDETVNLGLVIPLWGNVSTELDGDGGFVIKTEHHNYIFKPVSVQTMWTALLWIHKCLKAAVRAKHFNGGLSHAWLDYYQNRISSPRECINFWESMDDLINKREISFSYFDKVKTDEELLKGSIRNKLKEILTRFDLEEVTCRQVREALETEMKMSLTHLKGYVEEQLFVILGQMESSTKITDHLYLGSEWNACNLQELKDNGVGYILNVTKEVDNFFPGTFDYMNIRLYDVKEANLLHHWSKTYRFIHKAREHGVSTLVHCRRGISRSASTVIAYLMKENNMSLADAMKFVKSKRSIVQPNSGFWKQLIIYEGILKSSGHRHSSLFRLRSNSDSGNARRPNYKKGRHKNGADQVDSTPEHAHTLPRAANDMLCQGEDEPSDARETWNEDEDQDLMSSDEDISSNSNSDEDQQSKTRLKIRRTVSEPAMARADDVMMTSPTRKPRARTFAERQASENASSPTRITEDIEGEDDGITLSKDHEEQQDVVPEDEMAAVSESKSECLKPESAVADEVVESDVVEVEASVSEENIENVAETSAAVESTETLIDDHTSSTQQVTGSCEAEPTDASNIVKQVPSEESSPWDSSIESPREDVDSPREVVDSAREEFASPRTTRQRSRSIGEKLVDKHSLVKQGRSESSDNLKKVRTRGRVRRRERKAKSDLQLSSSGFVKRHTQIIEEQMLYSLLMNSDKTPATLAGDFWEPKGDNCGPSIAKDDFCETQSSSEKNMDSEATVTSEDRVDVSQNVEGQGQNNNEENSENVESVPDNVACMGETSCISNLQNFEKDEQPYSQKILQDNCEERSEESCDEDCEDKSETCSGKKRSEELQNIVQEVNAEAKRDIATQADATRATVASQDEPPRHVSDSDDVTIDPMTWIDLTQHHGNVVKRRSAAFEKNGKGTNASLPSSRDNLVQSRDKLSQSRNDHALCTCQERDETAETSMNDSAKVESSSRAGVPKLDFGELTTDETSLQRSNSIIVEDYNSWESSSVRDRTKILENIISKTGGSFPSPRSKARQNFKAETQLEEDMDELDISKCSTGEKASIAHEPQA